MAAEDIPSPGEQEEEQIVEKRWLLSRGWYWALKLKMTFLQTLTFDIAPVAPLVPDWRLLTLAYASPNSASPVSFWFTHYSAVLNRPTGDGPLRVWQGDDREPHTPHI